MRIVSINVRNFRSIANADLRPQLHNAYLGPNNIGKTTVLEALNFLLNPELSTRSTVVDENDFFCRRYRTSVHGVPATTGDIDQQPSTSELSTTIRVEAVLTELDKDDLKVFPNVLVAWDDNSKCVRESTVEGEDPFSNATPAIRVCFEAWYDESEDDFIWKTYFRNDPAKLRDECLPFTREHKRRVGFLIYRDYRALHRPITLEPYSLFSQLLSSQDASPKEFERVLESSQGAFQCLFSDPNFARVVNEYKQELASYLRLAQVGPGTLSFEVTDRTREQLKSAAQLHIEDFLPLPLQKMGAGTRSLATLAMLLMIARKRGRGIIALEEPETFLFPHAQRRLVAEVLRMEGVQTFVTTHSPYVLEAMPATSYQRLVRTAQSDVSAFPVVPDAAAARKLRERFRRQLGEALLGRAAIIVEEESTRLWIQRAGTALHGMDHHGKTREALELAGIGVVTASGNSDVKQVASILMRAGLRVVAFLDQHAKMQEFVELCSSMPNLPIVFHHEKGLERILCATLPRRLLTTLLSSMPTAKHVSSVADLDALEEDEFREKAFSFLCDYKGHITMHEWLIAQLDDCDIPNVLKDAAAVIADILESERPTICSVVPRRQ